MGDLHSFQPHPGEKWSIAGGQRSCQHHHGAEMFMARLKNEFALPDRVLAVNVGVVAGQEPSGVEPLLLECFQFNLETAAQVGDADDPVAVETGMDFTVRPIGSFALKGAQAAFFIQNPDGLLHHGERTTVMLRQLAERG